MDTFDDDDDDEQQQQQQQQQYQRARIIPNDVVNRIPSSNQTVH
jgi:hypothetical protein